MILLYAVIKRRRTYNQRELLTGKLLVKSAIVQSIAIAPLIESFFMLLFIYNTKKLTLQQYLRVFPKFKTTTFYMELMGLKNPHG